MAAKSFRPKTSRMIRREKRRFFYLFGILILGFGLRLWGISFGLPHLYHADEPIVVNHALAFGSGDLNPHFFKIPPLVSYLLFICYGIFYGMGKAAGFFGSPADLEHFFYADPTIFYWIARFIFGVGMGTVSVYLLYRLVKKYFSETRALAAALLLAVCFLHVRDSHYVYADIPLVLVLILGFFPILEILKNNDTRNHFMAGLFIGFATAVKYNGGALGVPYLTAAMLQPKKNYRGILIAGMTALSIYSILNPYTWFDFHYFFAEIQLQAHSQSGVEILHHLKYSFWEGVEPFVLMFGLLGILESFLQHNPTRQVISIFVLFYYTILVMASQPYDRYVLPLTPWVIVMAALFVFDLAEKRKRGKTFLPVLILLMALPNLAKSIRFDQIMSAKDVRTVAKEWIEKNIPEGSSIAMGWDFYSPRLSFSRAQLEDKKKELESNPGQFPVFQKRRLDFLFQGNDKKSPRYQLFFLAEYPENTPRFLFAKPLAPYDIKVLKEKGIQYVVVTRINDVQAKLPFFSSLEQEGKFLAEFSPYRDKIFRSPFDVLTLTGGPFLWKELLERERNGLCLRIYKLQ